MATTFTSATWAEAADQVFSTSSVAELLTPAIDVVLDLRPSKE